MLTFDLTFRGTHGSAQVYSLLGVDAGVNQSELSMEPQDATCKAFAPVFKPSSQLIYSFWSIGLVSGSQSAVLRAYWWQCSEDHIRYQGQLPGLEQARQAPPPPWY